MWTFHKHSLGGLRMQSSVQNKKPHEGMYDGSTTLHRMSTKSRAECLQAIGSTEGAKRAVDDVAKAEARASDAEAKSRGGPRHKAPDHLRQKSRQQVPQATQAHHHLLQPAPQRPNLHQSRCQRRQNHLGLLPQTNHNQHLSTRRNALIDVTYFFSSEPVTLSERPVLVMPGHYVVYSTFIDEPHKEWLVRGLWARPSLD